MTFVFENSFTIHHGARHLALNTLAEMPEGAEYRCLPPATASTRGLPPLRARNASLVNNTREKAEYTEIRYIENTVNEKSCEKALFPKIFHSPKIQQL